MKFRLFFLVPVAAVLGMIFFLLPDKSLDKSVIIDKIVVEKKKCKLHVYSKGTLVKTYRVSIGRNPKGRKLFEGDRKTPEGIYFITDKNPNSAYYKNLGISYPNERDKKYAEKLGKKPGGLIKIHGLKNGFGWIGKLHLLKNWTNGCIALTNNEMDELFRSVNIGASVKIMP